MKRFALIQAGQVVNVIESAVDPDGVLGDWVECGDVGPGWSYAAGAFSMPAAPVVPRRVSRQAFDDRFTDAENINIEYAALDVSTATLAQRKAAARIRVFLRKVALMPSVDLNRPNLRAAVTWLEAQTVIGAGRALEILDAPIQDDERA